MTSSREKVGRKVGRPTISTQVFDIIKCVAETEGFEPSVPLTGYDDLANRCLQPLGHVSGEGLLSCFARRAQWRDAYLTLSSTAAVSG